MGDIGLSTSIKGSNTRSSRGAETLCGDVPQQETSELARSTKSRDTTLIGGKTYCIDPSWRSRESLRQITSEPARAALRRQTWCKKVQ
jgi:hypothetical protein